MNPNEKQKYILKTYLKPKLKENGFLTLGNNWWKNKGEFFIVINLQNSQFNSKDKISFCFNIGIALTDKLIDPEKKKATYYDLATNVREDGYLSNSRKKHKYRADGWLGYVITKDTMVSKFVEELKIDFENEILPKIDGLRTINDCLKFYKQFDFWGENLEKQVDEIKKNKSISN